MELGPWSVLGQKALSTKKYVPDFDAVALPPCRLLRIPQSAYGPALDSTRLPPIAPFNVSFTISRVPVLLMCHRYQLLLRMMQIPVCLLTDFPRQSSTFLLGMGARVQRNYHKC
jgi:hypothetical protein